MTDKPKINANEFFQDLKPDPAFKDWTEKQAPGWPSIVPLRDFMAAQPPTPPEVVHGVIRAGQVAMLAASSKAGKSWAIKAACLSVGSGRPWLQWKTAPGDVLYINGELGAFDLYRRNEKLAAAMGLPEYPGGVEVWHLRGRRVRIAGLLPKIQERIEARGKPFSLICPDPLYYFNGGRDENDNTAQAETMGELAELAESTGAAVLVAHHFSKGNKSGAEHLDRASGAGMFARAADVFITMTRHEEDDCYTVETTCRSFARPEPFVVRWDYPLWRIADDLDPEALKRPGPSRKPRFTVDSIVLALPRGGARYSDWREAAERAVGIKESAFAVLLKKAVKMELVEKDVFGVYARRKAAP